VNKETFCSLPFTEIFLGPDGDIKTCCSASEALGNLNEDKIEDILQCHKAVRIRQNIIDGKWDTACKQCQRQESQNVRSERKNNLNEFVKEHENFSADYFNPKKLDLRWSNTCNLSCVYCYEYFSSKWSTIKGITVNTLKDENENDFLLYIEKNAMTINNIMLLGGEPLLQKQNSALLGMIPKASVYILTNLAVPLKNNPLATKLISSNNVSYGVSFETVKDRYEYVRHGADWSVFDNNLDYLVEKVENFAIDAHALYSIYSAFNLVEFYEYILEKKVFRLIYWNLLESSGENSSASVLFLNESLKLKAVAEIEKCEKLFPNAPGIDSLSSIKHSLLNQTTTTNNHPALIQEIESVELQLNKSPNKKFQHLWNDIYKELL
jgi:radical SAM protein with 4Fe4S-binding SPASM domain